MIGGGRSFRFMVAIQNRRAYQDWAIVLHAEIPDHYIILSVRL